MRRLVLLLVCSRPAAQVLLLSHKATHQGSPSADESRHNVQRPYIRVVRLEVS